MYWKKILRKLILQVGWYEISLRIELFYLKILLKVRFFTILKTELIVYFQHNIEQGLV